MKLYINGKLEATDNSKYDILPDCGDPEIFIGMRGNSTYPFHGKIDNLRIYNIALIENEVKDLFMEQLCLTNISVTDTLIIKSDFTNLNPDTYNFNIKVYPNHTHDHLLKNCGDISKLVGYSIKIINSADLSGFQSNIYNQIQDLDLNT